MIAPGPPVSGSFALGSKLLSNPYLVLNGLSVEYRTPMLSVRFEVTLQSSWTKRPWTDERGSQLVNSDVNRPCATYPVRKPAKVLPVFGTVAPFGCSPAVTPANENTVGRAKLAVVRRK